MIDDGAVKIKAPEDAGPNMVCKLDEVILVDKLRGGTTNCSITDDAACPAAGKTLAAGATMSCKYRCEVPEPSREVELQTKTTCTEAGSPAREANATQSIDFYSAPPEEGARSCPYVKLASCKSFPPTQICADDVISNLTTGYSCDSTYQASVINNDTTTAASGLFEFPVR